MKAENITLQGKIMRTSMGLRLIRGEIDIVGVRAYSFARAYFTPSQYEEIMRTLDVWPDRVILFTLER